MTTMLNEDVFGEFATTLNINGEIDAQNLTVQDDSMDMLLVILHLGLATWRLSSMFSQESGAGHVFVTIRRWAGAKTITQDDLDDVEDFLDELPPIAESWLRNRELHEGLEYPTNKLSEGIMCPWCNSVWFGALVGWSFFLAPSVTLRATFPLLLSALSLVVHKFIGEK